MIAETHVQLRERRMRIALRIVNSGQSPARDIELTVSLAIHVLDTNELTFNNIQIQSPYDLGAGRDREEKFDFEVPSDNILRKISNEAVRITAIVSMSCKDVFGEPDHSRATYDRFCDPAGEHITSVEPMRRAEDDTWEAKITDKSVIYTL